MFIYLFLLLLPSIITNCQELYENLTPQTSLSPPPLSGAPLSIPANCQLPISLPRMPHSSPSVPSCIPHWSYSLHISEERGIKQDAAPDFLSTLCFFVQMEQVRIDSSLLNLYLIVFFFVSDDHKFLNLVLVNGIT